MNKGSGAKIIRFPGRLRLSVDLAARLGEAIRALDQANTKLSDEFPDLHTATKALTVSLGKIAGSLHVLDTGSTTASSPMTDGRTRTWSFFRDDRNSDVVAEPRVSVNDALTINRIVLNDAGIGIVSCYLSAPEIEAERLVHLLPEWTPPQ